MRHLGLAAFAALALVFTPAVSRADWGSIVYEFDTLERQQQECPPRGGHPQGGCDQCLPFAHHPVWPLLEVFCGPSRGCRLWPALQCDICNGTCWGSWTEQLMDRMYRYAPVTGVEVVQQVITNCNQWTTQDYCPEVKGAYLGGESFDWMPIPIPGLGGYLHLPFDPEVRDQLAAYAGPNASLPGEAWFYRIGLFTALSFRSPPGPRKDYYQRAANLALWYYVFAYVPDGQDDVRNAMGLPASLTSRDWGDLDDIHEATCGSRPFSDCWEAVEPSTWGGIKHLYRER